MLGRLAKWLRLLGFDTVYLREGPGHPLSGRILLTRRTSRPHQPQLPGWDRIVRLTANDIQGQLAETAAKLGIEKEMIRPFARCSLCNRELETLDRALVQPLVPPYVFATQASFAQCPGCGRIYWQATHHDKMVKIIKGLFPGSP